MIKCPNCGSKMESWGEHNFCIKCHFTKFDLTDEYIDQCAKLLAILMCNTEFPSYAMFEDTVAKFIELHLPMLQNWLSTIIIGRTVIQGEIRNAIRMHAVNLIIKEE